MSSTIASTAVSTETTIGELVAARPGLARLFEQLGIDYCCGGKQTLAAACRRRGLDPATTLALLDAGAAVAAGPAEVDAAAMGQAQLADHIVSTHHAFLKSELPRLVEMADKVGTKHAWRDARLAEVMESVRQLRDEMMSHMQKEEIVLFPLVRLIEVGAPSGMRSSADLAAPIRQMEAEHDSAGRLTARLRELTDDFTPDADACNTHRALLAGLAKFEADLHRHVHKENNILFPRALAQAAVR